MSALKEFMGALHKLWCKSKAFMGAPISYGSSPKNQFVNHCLLNLSGGFEKQSGTWFPSLEWLLYLQGGVNE